MAARPTPYDLVFGDDAVDAFGRVRASLTEHGSDPADRDTFLMNRDVITFIRDLRPDEGMGEGIEQLAALVHHAYLFWAAGRYVCAVASEILADASADRPGATGEPAERSPAAPAALYAQLPEHRLWAAAVPGEPAEPLDGCFIHAAGTELRVLGILGLRPDRMGFSVVEAAGERPGVLVRPDGSAAFSSQLPGGAAAGLHSLAGGEELLELGWRAWTA